MKDLGGGWIALHRKTLDSYLWDLPDKQRLLAITILLMCGWKERDSLAGRLRIKLKRGQIWTTYDELARESRLTKKCVRVGLQKLARCEFLKRERAQSGVRGGTLITVINFQKYQNRDFAEGTLPGTEGAELGPFRGTIGAQLETQLPEPTGGFSPLTKGTRVTKKQNYSSVEIEGETLTEFSIHRHYRGKRPPAAHLRQATEFFLEAFNRYFESKFQPRAWQKNVSKALREGFTPAEMKGAAWGAHWGMGPEVLCHCTPNTILRTNSRENKTTLAQWLEKANNVWEREKPGKPKPWDSAPKLVKPNGESEKPCLLKLPALGVKPPL